MDIPCQFKQIGITIHQYRFISPLKEEDDPTLLSVNPTGIAKRKVLYDLGKGNLADMYGQMHMIAHTAEGVYPITEAGGTFLNKQIQVGIVLITIEDLLAAIPTQHDVINTPWNMNSWFASHDT